MQDGTVNQPLTGQPLRKHFTAATTEFDHKGVRSSLRHTGLKANETPKCGSVMNLWGLEQYNAGVNSGCAGQLLSPC